jgi:hypothetical protein
MSKKDRRKAALKKRRKDKARRKKRQQAAAVRPSRGHVRRARNYPVFECLINPSWREGGLATILLSRQQPDGGIVFGVYLVDIFCLGLKNTYCNANFSRARYAKVKPGIFVEEPPRDCPLDLAHQVIYGAIDYAAQLGFRPQKDFSLSKYILEERGALPESHHVSFGKDGKPFFMAGPYDNISAIRGKLERAVGPDNYHFLIPIDPDDMLED